jgi:predicted  nucleic acid-binding Zn-ribbon protein
MDATLSSEATARAQQGTTKDYKSRPGALIWFFRKSRDLWKSKYQALKASVKQLKNHVADLTKSREQWRLKAEQANDQLGALKAEIADLQARVEALTSPKKTTQAGIR